MKNILVAVDLRDTDQLLIEQAAALATKFTSKVWIVHVAAPDPDFVGYGVGPTYIRDTRADQLRKEHRQLQSYAGWFNDQAINADGLLIQGPTINMIKDEVKKLKIDLLIIGSHRHSFLYEAFVGHTEVKIIRDILIPVLIVPLPDVE
ncbi:MAG TPA: universal stress protein [Saprospiraceae bacterium]|nr:universal stress protein [Saprospiraceae bacterium]